MLIDKNMKILSALFLFAFVSSAFCLNRHDCKCRVASTGRIVAGSRSDVVYPWLVSIFSLDDFRQPSGKFRFQILTFAFQI